jgi:rieske iron-sulfur protein
MFCGGLALALEQLVAPSARAAAEPRNVRPQPGDFLVFAEGERAGKQVLVADCAVGQAPQFAFPMDPATQVVRDGAPFNRVLLVRLAADEISARTRPHAADGVLAYSAICTHYGCQITLLAKDQRGVTCNCHGSTFDAGNNGEIVVGPATRRLAFLPLKTVEGALVVAAGFSGRLGPPQQ